MHLLSIGLAALLRVAVMFFWWSPFGFLQAWQALAGVSQPELRQRMIYRGILFAIAGSVLIAVVLQVGLAGMHIQTAASAAGLGLAAGMGLVVPPMLSPVVFEGKSFRLFLINVGFQLVTLAGMAAVLGALATSY